MIGLSNMFSRILSWY